MGRLLTLMTYSSQDNLKRLMKEAEKYPLALRIAAHMHLCYGWTEATMAEVGKTDIFKSGVSCPLRVAVQNALRDIDTGFVRITPALKRLALDLSRRLP